MARTLNVKQTTRVEVFKHWRFFPPNIFSDPIFIRCNAKGEVNWEKAPLYKVEELIERNNVKLIKTFKNADKTQKN